MKMKALRTEPVCTEVRGHSGCTVGPLCSSLSIDLDLTSRYKTPAWGRTEEVFSFSVFDVLLSFSECHWAGPGLSALPSEAQGWPWETELPHGVHFRSDAPLDPRPP